MPQDRGSGADAAAWGLAMGRRLAPLLDAELVGQRSNEVRWRDRTAVIKSCRFANTSFGVTTAMLERLDCILVAIEDATGAYDVHEMPADRFRAGMRESRSGGGDPKVQVIGRADAERHGRLVARFSRDQVAGHAFGAAVSTD